MSFAGKFWTGYIVLLILVFVLLMSSMFGCSTPPKKSELPPSQDVLMDTWSAEGMERMSCVFEDLYDKEVPIACVSMLRLMRRDRYNQVPY